MGLVDLSLGKVGLWGVPYSRKQKQGAEPAMATIFHWVQYRLDLDNPCQARQGRHLKGVDTD